MQARVGKCCTEGMQLKWIASLLTLPNLWLIKNSQRLRTIAEKKGERSPCSNASKHNLQVMGLVTCETSSLCVQ